MMITQLPLLSMDKPLVDQLYLLKKFPGKGGWTYADLPEVEPDKNAPFGWIRVNGSIDGVEIRKYHLMPGGKGNLFLPVKAAIRKKIGKQAGDQVHVILYRDPDPGEIPEELLSCLEDEPAALAFFHRLEDAEKSAYVNWIYAAKTDAVKVERIIAATEKLKGGKRLRD